MKPLDSNTLLDFTKLVSSALGLNYAGERLPDLERGLRSAARELGVEDSNLLARQMLSSLKQEHTDALARHLTVGETHFFRHPEAFEALEHHIFPDLLQRRGREGQRKLRVWSAACSTGEEPYSVAITLHRAIKDFGSWDITILATDINTCALESARDACYSEWSFRGVSEEIKHTYFARTRDGRLRLVPEIKNMVTFARLNLAGDCYPSPQNGTECMDVVLCRNVLIYFTQDQANRTMERLCRSLAVGGWLLTSPVETMYGRETDLVPRTVGRATFLVNEPAKLANGICVREVSVPSRADKPKTPRPTAKAGAKPRRKPVSRTSRAEDSAYSDALGLYDAARYEAATEELLAAVEAGRAGDGKGQHEILLARCYANTGNRTDALIWCRRAIAANRVDAEYHYLHATILSEQNEVDEAAEALKRVLFLDQDHLLAHYALGAMQRRRGRGRDARRHFETAAALLRRRDGSDVLPSGMSAGRLAEAINEVLTEARK